MTDDHAHDPRLSWLLPRVDKRCIEAVESLLDAITEQLAIATADAVSVRLLSDDGQFLLPLTAYHPDPKIRSAMAAVMAQTVQRVDIGTWLSVIHEQQPRRWRIPPGYVPPEASEQQADFFARYPIRALLVVPVVHEDRTVGGVSVSRFTTDHEYTDQDEALALAFAGRIAPALDFRTRLGRLTR